MARGGAVRGAIHAVIAYLLEAIERGDRDCLP